jgi:UDP-N-acetylmuramoyl-L-alanyl-D-glutamate--2,6-diaminopimelate ligase
VINADDPNAEFFSAFPADKFLSYGLKTSAEVSGYPIYKPNSTEFIVINRAGLDALRTSMPGAIFDPVEHFFSILLVGEFNVLNALAAIAATQFLIDESQVVDKVIQQGLVQVRSIPGRMERIDEGQPYTAIVDFAHTPNALENALKACRGMLTEGKRLIAIIGSAGLRDRDKRRLMAEVAPHLADFTILTAEDPRTESLDDILETMAQGCISQGGVEGQTFIRVPDRGQALYQACQMAQAGDIVIACGKGHEQSMCFGTTEYPWDDRQALRAAIKGTPLKTLPTAQI